MKMNFIYSKRNFFLIIVLFIIKADLLSQTTDDNTEKLNPILKVFANFHSGINDAVKDESAFEIKRAYLGFGYQYDENFLAKVQLDIGSPNDQSQYSLLRRFSYFKNAYLQYKKDKITVQFGIIGLHQFKTQEKFWGRRYIYKSFQDKHKFGSSADLGASIVYKASKMLSFDVAVMNGEGYSGLQSDNNYKTGIGMTLSLFNSLTYRAYYDFISEKETQSTISNFIGYKHDKFSLGGEYVYKINYGFEKDYNYYGLSVYGSLKLQKNIELFARFDKVDSDKLSGESTPWRLEKDGSAIISGIQYKPISKIKFSLNYQDWYPSAKNSDNEAFIYFNIEFSI